MEKYPQTMLVAHLPMCLFMKNPQETPNNFVCPLFNVNSFLKCLKSNCNVILFSFCLLGQQKVGIGRTITVPMDIMSVLVAVLSASGTMKQTIIVMQEKGL